MRTSSKELLESTVTTDHGTMQRLLPVTCGVAKDGPGTCQSTMFIPLISPMSRDLARSTRKREANWLAYSRCPANTNDLAAPLLGQIPAVRPYLAQPRGTEYDRTALGHALTHARKGCGPCVETLKLIENQKIDAGGDDKL